MQREEEIPEDPTITALREAFSRLAERLTPDIEPAPVYRLDVLDDAGAE